MLKRQKFQILQLVPSLLFITSCAISSLPSPGQRPCKTKATQQVTVFFTTDPDLAPRTCYLFLDGPRRRNKTRSAKLNSFKADTKNS
ncbi:hypothetical protein BX600DRAFT_34117 [Xylariales sp. PMI_506]|nr:hypothetical protein BX600DRAFT_34117 [Xylariales sp. PMI_506]